MCFCLFKNLWELNNQKKRNISKGGSQTCKNFVVLVFPKVILVFFCICGFPEGFFGCLKTFGKTKQPKKTNPYPRVGLKPLSTLCFGFSLRFLLVFFGFLWHLWFSRRFLLFSQNLRENQTNKKQTWVPFRSQKSQKKHHAFEFWCLECSSLGPTAKISIHLSNSVWLVCVGVCMVLYKFNRFACTA